MRSCAFFGMRHQRTEARVTMKRLKIRILFDREIESGCQGAVDRLLQ